MRIAPFIVSAVMLSGCAATYKQDTLAEPSAKLVRGYSIAIATPADGIYGTTVYQSSGKMTSLAVRAALPEVFRRDAGSAPFAAPANVGRRRGQ